MGNLKYYYYFCDYNLLLFPLLLLGTYMLL